MDPYTRSACTSTYIQSVLQFLIIKCRIYSCNIHYTLVHNFIIRTKYIGGASSFILFCLTRKVMPKGVRFAIAGGGGGGGGTPPLIKTHYKLIILSYHIYFDSGVLKRQTTLSLVHHPILIISSVFRIHTRSFFLHAQLFLPPTS